MPYIGHIAREASRQPCDPSFTHNPSMEFKLPDNLLKQVADYDPAVRAMRELRPAVPANAEPTRITLGLPDDLFPYGIMGRDDQIKLAKRFNMLPDRERHFYQETDRATAMLVYVKSQWIALWHRKTRLAESDYIYGVTVIHKDTPTTIARVDNLVIGQKENNLVHLSDHADPVPVKYGRIKMLRTRLLVTADMIRAGANRLPTNFPYTRPLAYKIEQNTKFEKSLGKAISCWEDYHGNGGILGRMATTDTDVRLVVFGYLTEEQKEKSFAELLVSRCLGGMYETEAKDNIRRILDTPYFRKEVNKVFDTTLERFTNPDNKQYSEVLKPSRCFEHKFKVLVEFVAIYPDVSLDYYQQVFEIALNLDDMGFNVVYGAGGKWIGENMPVQSYIGIIKKCLEDTKKEWGNRTGYSYRYSINHRTNEPVARLSNLSDTLRMMNTLHHHQNKNAETPQPLVLARPDRWRITELHDQVNSELFKISTPNEKLPQDLFPEPIRMEESGKKWSFFQPHDVHQLALWGRTVRNCVGSADTYRIGIKKKTHFIVLVLVDNKPVYTVQLMVQNGAANVQQIVGVSNSRLSDHERSLCQKALGRAFSIRSQQLEEVA